MVTAVFACHVLSQFGLCVCVGGGGGGGGGSRC